LEQISLRVHESELDIKEWCTAALASSKYLIAILDNGTCLLPPRRRPRPPPRALRRLLSPAGRFPLPFAAVLDQSKLEQGKLVLEEKEINFSVLCHSCVNMLQHTKAAAVKLSVAVPPDLVVIGDHMRWRQVLVNLLSNALKFTTSGSVTLSVVCKERCALFVAVSDTGPGINRELAPMLFQRYAQGASSHKGSGLGLSIAQLIVQLYHSDIKVDSPWDAAGTPGTRFSFTVPDVVMSRGSPAAPTLDETAAPAAVSSPGGGAVQAALALQVLHAHQPCLQTVKQALQALHTHQSGVLNVLIVEDDKLNCMIMDTKLRQAMPSAASCSTSITIEVVHTGEAALDKFREGVERSEPHAFDLDLVLMDEHMESAGGKLKGSETTKLLREMGMRGVIVACSGNCLADDRTLYLAAGASHVWPKPYPNAAEIGVDLQNWFGGLAARGSPRTAGKELKGKGQTSAGVGVLG
jgi:CheY-like chemotaxis protein